MNDPENFLKRWSRRKRDTVKVSARSEAPEPQPGGEIKLDTAGPLPAATPETPAFDLSKLPSLDSITSDSDITAFLQPGVPAALKHAALRRVWAADPAIRNFMGPTENYWDAAGPDGVPGFGDLDPNLDVKRLIAELFGEAPPETAKPDSLESSIGSASSDENSDEQAVGRIAATSHEILSMPEGGLSHRTENGAAQNNSQDPQPAKKLARRHGGALPE